MKKFKEGDQIFIPWTKLYSFAKGYAKGTVVSKLDTSMYRLRIDGWEFMNIHRHPQEINLYKEDEWEDE